MTNNEKIQRAEQLIAEANALLSEVKSTHDNEEDVIAKYKEDYCKGKKYYINDDSHTSWIVTPNAYTFENTSNPYRFYLTEELAEQAKKLKDFNDKLLAFKYCYDLDYKPVFSGDYNDCAYFVYYDSKDNKYDYDWDSADNNTVYFSSEEVARKCADWLNSLNE
jgi:hypothetical protein